ncbi:MAG: antibiotic biosynthesis monooxygenase [Eubacteriales bacterium]|nr:antibiotic biosynthesis monooxygenase [Eubacteriales bacterium]MDD3881306.1 antibiotic biosynthesis monooxygenase [Eubacteriales bacterium]MDD4512224.1 antibiotic biosynthesis monooxygenase [Eubacteriales bacterium]
MNPFAQTILFQVKPDKLTEFETLIRQAQAEQKRLEGCISAEYMKRFYTFDNVESCEAPRELTKIVKCVKYYGFFRFDTIESCGRTVGWLFENYAKEIMKLLIMPFDVMSGYLL